MGREMELLAPGGDVDSIKAAIAAGANAVYCGLDKFNARNRAANIAFDDLHGILDLAHKHNCEVFITLNIVIVDAEIPALITLLNKLVNTAIDAVIVQDLGLFYLLSKYFKSLKVHASTQMTTHNEGQVRFIKQLNANRFNVSRELNILEIKHLAAVGHENDMLNEVFVHGSNCLSFSGLCYMSSVHSGNSGNRGRCSQPCRDKYETTAAGKDFPLNLKDNSAFFDLKELSEAGVDSLKIEGRIKKFHYVYSVVNTWRKHLQYFYETQKLTADNGVFYKVFNRDFSNAFLKGNLNNDLFIDNPRDHSAIHLAQKNGVVNDETIEDAKTQLFHEKLTIIDDVNEFIEKLSVDKEPLEFKLKGVVGEPLVVEVASPSLKFEIQSKGNLERKGVEPISYELVIKRFKAVNDTKYFIKQVDCANLSNPAFIPFKELTAMKKQLLYALNGNKALFSPIALPALKRPAVLNEKPRLSVLISSVNDLHLCGNNTTSIYYQLPNGLSNECDELISLFKLNKQLIPWFPPVLIGDDYQAALIFMDAVRPKLIVANNSGVGYEANIRGIAWIAGPYLNLVNSYGLLCLKEKFNCAGAFISNEINISQLRGIRPPEDFDLYYSIFHPIVLMTSRQCLSHQISGCYKQQMDKACLHQCVKYDVITNESDVSFRIEKTKGNYHSIYHDTHYLNTKVDSDFQGLFSRFFIDLRDVATTTKMELDKAIIISLFENHLKGDLLSTETLNQKIYPTSNLQYTKGI